MEDLAGCARRPDPPTARCPASACRGILALEERLFFAPFVWAKALENAPEPSSATKTPMRQKTEPIKTRRLKNPPSPSSFAALRRDKRLRRAGADCEVDFFFMDEVELFPSAVNP